MHYVLDRQIPATWKHENYVNASIKPFSPPTPSLEHITERIPFQSRTTIGYFLVKYMHTTTKIEVWMNIQFPFMQHTFNLFLLQKNVKFIKSLIVQTMHEKLIPQHPLKLDLLSRSIKRW
jgi:hypothetical protein